MERYHAAGRARRSTREPTALAFDVYGTLGDPARMADGSPPSARTAERMARSWRTHQLEISWLVSLMGRYEDFEAVTAYALETALAEAGLKLEGETKRKLLAALERLELYEDVARQPTPVSPRDAAYASCSATTRTLGRVFT